MDARESAKNLVTEFLQSPGSNKELEAKFGEANLRAAVENIVGWSVVQLIKRDRSIALTDLQTDLRDMIHESASMSPHI
jgi:hypothetical protein